MSILLRVGPICFAVHGGSVPGATPPWFATMGTQPSTGSNPQAVEIGDLDGDNLPDLIVVNRGGDSISIIRNNGSGNFGTKVDYATGLGPQSVAIGDLNSDGALDLAVANNNATTVSVLLNNGNGTFAPKVDYIAGANPFAVAVADFDGDGSPDLASANANSFSASVLRNNGNGTFATAAAFGAGNTPFWVSARDIDADGKPDLAVVNALSHTVSLLRNTSTGPGSIAFALKIDFATGTGPYSVSIDDVTGDGKPDLATPNAISNTVSVFTNSSSGPGSIAFAPRADYAAGPGPRTAAIRDLDNDGRADLVVANWDGNNVSVLQNNAGGTFAAAQDFSTGRRPRNVAVGDLDADGRAEIVVANSQDNNLTILWNRSQVVYVRANLTTGNNDGSSWANAYRELRTALTDLDSAPWIREIWVSTGTYTPAPSGGSRTASFTLRNNLAIYGGFAGNETALSQRNITQNPTVLSGDLNNDDAGDLNRSDNSYHVVKAAGLTLSAVLDGVTVTAGNANTTTAMWGGALLIASGDLTVRNVVFVRNIARQGGAVHSSSGANPVFLACRFIANTAVSTVDDQELGGAYYAFSSSPVFRDCSFEDNLVVNGLSQYASGGAFLAIQDCNPVFTNCSFLRNRTPSNTGASALGFTIRCNPRLIGCTVAGNVGGGTVWVVTDSFLTVVNSAFIGNLRPSPGDPSVINFGGTNTGGSIVNSVVAFNVGTSLAGGAVNFAGTPGGRELGISNSILWGNTVGATGGQSAQIAQQGGTMTISHSTIDGWTGSFGGNGNNGGMPADDPRFLRLPSPGPDAVYGTADDDYGNLRLPQSSPALDTGDNAAVPPDSADIDNDGNTTEYIPLDLDGSPRIQNNTVDRGCYEGFRCPICPNDRQWFGDISGTWSDDPRWSFSTPTSCLYALLDAAGQPYTINFNNADATRGLLHTRNTVTLSAPALSDTLTLRPPGIGATCPNGVPQTFRPALLVSGAVLDNPTLNITSGTVNASSGFIAEPFGEVGTINVIGPEAKLTFASGTCSIGDQGEGTLTVQGGATAAAGFFFVGQGDIDSEPDGVFDLHGSILIDGPGSTLKPKFSLNITHGTVAVRNQGLIDCGTTGTVFVLPGSSLTGDGTVIGRVVNFGDVGLDDTAPGATTGTGAFQPKALTITSPPGGAASAYEQLGTDPKDGPRTGTLRLRTGGSAGAILADSLVINGNAKIAGTLVVEPVGSFAPATNAPAASLLSAAVVQGRFDLAVFPGVGGDRFLRLSYAGATGERGAGVSVTVAPLTSNINLDPPSSANVGGVPTDIVAADFDNDPSQDLDLALTVPDAANPTTAPGTVVILKNAGNTGPGGSWAGFTGGQLTFNVGVNPRGLAKGDFNADGVPDLAVANAGSNSLTVLRNLNNGTGAMTTNQTISVGTSPVAVVTGVFRDSSSAIDVAVVNQGSNSITVLNNTGGTLATSATLSTGEAPSDITAAQLDSGSATLDLAVTNRDDDTVTVYYRPPAAGFPVIPSRILPVGPRPAAIDPGGLDNPKEINDLAVTNFGGGSTSILLNNQRPGIDAGFQPKADLPTGTNPDSITLGDLDNDGDPDLSVVTTVNAQRVVRVFRNDVQQVAPGEYQAAFAPFDDAYAGTGPRLVIAGDVNSDGRDDLIAVNDQTLIFRPAPESGGSGAAGGAGGAGGAGNDAQPERVLVEQPNVSTSLSLAPNVPAPCAGDLVPAVGDNVVNTADLVAFLGQFGRTCASLAQGARCGDFNNDNLVNTADLVTFLGRFGRPCR